MTIRSGGSTRDLPSVLLVHEFYRERAGEDAVFEAELALLEAKGHDVEVLTVDNADIPDPPTVGQRVRMGLETIHSSRSARLIERRLRRRPADIVHVHNTLPLLSPSIYRAARSTGSAVVQTIHNYRTICPAATLYREGKPCESCVGQRVPWPSVLHGCYRGSRVQTVPIAAMLTSARLRHTWDDVDAFIVLTSFAAEKLAEGGLPRDRLHEKANFSPDPGLRDGDGEGYVFIGRLTPEKGIGTLIDAWQQLPENIALRVIGQGPERARVDAAASTMTGWQPLGRLDRAEVQAELARSRALIFPSQWYEGQPMTIIEAFAAGVPVIAARIGAAAAMVADHRTGLLFEPGDVAGLAAAVTWAEDHPEAMRAYGLAARLAYDARYTADASHARLLEIYEAAQSRSVARRQGDAA